MIALSTSTLMKKGKEDIFIVFISFNMFYILLCLTVRHMNCAEFGKLGVLDFLNIRQIFINFNNAFDERNLDPVDNFFLIAFPPSKLN